MDFLAFQMALGYNDANDEQSRLLWAGNTSAPPSAGNGTCGSQTPNSGLNGAGYTNSFVYTHLGQLWQAPLNGSGTSYQYLYCENGPHQLTGLYPTGATCGNKSNSAYSSSNDAWGNVTSRTYQGNTATLSYDTLDRLTKWSNGSGSNEQYIYDAGGNRVLRRSTSGGTTTMTAYAFGVEEHQYDGTGVTQGKDTYYYSLGGRLIGELTGSPSKTSIFLTDALGSVVSTFSNTAGSAAVLGSQVYGPYGAQRYTTGNVGTAKGFTGQYNDSVTGLDYYNARYYDPVAGVFLSADTVQGNGAGMNPYGYVGGNPETLSDPSGERFAPPPCGPDGCHGGGGSSVGGAGGGGGSSVGGAGGGGGAIASPYWLRYLQPFLTGSPRNSSITHGVSDVTNLSPCGGFSSADCLKANWAAQTQVHGHVVVSRPISGGINLGQPVCLGMGMSLMSMCTTMSSPSTGITVSTVIQVSGNMVTPMEGCATLFACLAQDEGGGGEKPTDGVEELCSFTSRTAVTTERGKRPIGTLRTGEKVLAYNPQTHKMEMQPILHVWINHDNDLVDLTLTTKTQHGKAITKTSETIHTNKKHPFLTTEKGFVTVGQLKVGMHVVRAGGGVGVITGWKLVPGVMTMYNLEVAQDHTFTVGDGQWVVHNCGSTLRDGIPVSISDHGFNHSFDRHASEWFGRDVTESDKPAWRDLIRQAMNSKNIFLWSTGSRDTIGVLARLPYYDEVRPFVVQFDRATGELATAFRPNPAQLQAINTLLGR